MVVSVVSTGAVRCIASPPIAAALPVGLGSGSGLLTRPICATRGRPNGATRHPQCDHVRKHVVRTGRPRKPGGGNPTSGVGSERGEPPRADLGREADPKQGQAVLAGFAGGMWTNVDHTPE